MFQIAYSDFFTYRFGNIDTIGREKRCICRETICNSLPLLTKMMGGVNMSAGMAGMRKETCVGRIPFIQGLVGYYPNLWCAWIQG
jgi:hypothetical protein